MSLKIQRKINRWNRSNVSLSVLCPSDLKKDTRIYKPQKATLLDKCIIPKLNSSLFDWQKWRANSIHSLGFIACRYRFIVSVYGKYILKKHAVGYCEGENLACRPKLYEIALMCFKDGGEFWFHMRSNEFEEVFCN